MIRRFVLSFTLGLVFTLALVGLAIVLDDAGFKTAPSILIWPNTLLQSLVPIGNIGTPENPVYEGSPLNLLAFLASIPLGTVVYGTLAHFFLVPRLRWRA